MVAVVPLHEAHNRPVYAVNVPPRRIHDLPSGSVCGGRNSLHRREYDDAPNKIFLAVLIFINR